MLRQAGAEHHNALVVNLASIAGKSPQPWLSVYSATKAAVVAYTSRDEQGARRRRGEVGGVLPGVRRHRHDRLHQGVRAPEQMIRPEDIAEALRFVLRLSPDCVMPEIIFERPGETV